jgi:hypothetical protein
MLRQIHEYEEEHGVRVSYFVLTDLSRDAINNPHASINGRKPIFRDPMLNPSGYSADLPDDAYSYFRALKGGHIIPGVKSVQFEPQTSKLIIKTVDASMAVERPHIFALLGYERNEELFRQVGAAALDAVGDNLPQPLIRPGDGAIRTEADGYTSNLFAIGACAATPYNPRAGGIPGIFGQVPWTVLTIAVRNLQDQPDNLAA